MDRRDRNLKWYSTFDEKRMIVTIEGYSLSPADNNDDEDLDANDDDDDDDDENVYDDGVDEDEDEAEAEEKQETAKEVEFPVVFEVCGTCDGRGKHVNPSIDSHGLTALDFDEDPDFRENYLSGMYDVSCNECGGRRVVPVLDEIRATPEQIKYVADHIESRYRDELEHDAERRMGA